MIKPNVPIICIYLGTKGLTPVQISLARSKREADIWQKHMPSGFKIVRVPVAMAIAAQDLFSALELTSDALVNWVEIADKDDLRESDNEALAASKAAISKAKGG